MPIKPWPCSQYAAQISNPRYADSYPRFPIPVKSYPVNSSTLSKPEPGYQIIYSEEKHTSPLSRSLTLPAQTIPPRRHRTYPLNLPIGTQPPRRPKPHLIIPKHLLIPQIRLRKWLLPGVRPVPSRPISVLLRLGAGGPPAAREGEIREAGRELRLRGRAGRRGGRGGRGRG